MVRSDRPAELLAQLIAQHGVDGSFWQAVRRCGTPLIENGSTAGTCLITFIYQGDENTHNVLLVSCLNRQDIKKNSFTRYDNSSLWFLSLEVGADLRTRYLLSPNDLLRPFTDNDGISSRSKDAGVDKFNPNHLVLPAMEDDPDDEFDAIFSVLELPKAANLSYAQLQPEVPRGHLEKFRFNSKTLANERSLWLYLPADVQVNNIDQLLIVFDGWSYTTVIPTPIILDKLIHQGDISATVAIFVEHDSLTQRNQELCCNEEFAHFLKHELMPWIKQKTGIKPSPDKTTLLGSSFGGLAACYSALLFPETFGRVLVQSCSVMWNNRYIVKLFEEHPAQKLQMVLTVGQQEFSHRAEQYTTTSTQAFYRLLQQKGYAVQYQEYNGGHDYNCWAAALVGGLTALDNA